MKSSKYRDRRAFALRIFGMAMLVLSAVFTLAVSPLLLLREKNHSTAFVTGRVVSVDGERVKIYYLLPGEDEGWLVTMQGFGWEKDDEVRVFYNPENLSEKYIEGFKDSPWEYGIDGLVGMLVGAGALLPAWLAKEGGGHRDADLSDGA